MSHNGSSASTEGGPLHPISPSHPHASKTCDSRYKEVKATVRSLESQVHDLAVAQSGHESRFRNLECMYGDVSTLKANDDEHQTLIRSLQDEFRSQTQKPQNINEDPLALQGNHLKVNGEIEKASRSSMEKCGKDLQQLLETKVDTHSSDIASLNSKIDQILELQRHHTSRLENLENQAQNGRLQEHKRSALEMSTRFKNVEEAIAKMQKDGTTIKQPTTLQAASVDTSQDGELRKRQLSPNTSPRGSPAAKRVKDGCDMTAAGQPYNPTHNVKPEPAPAPRPPREVTPESLSKPAAERFRWIRELKDFDCTDFTKYQSLRENFLTSFLRFPLFARELNNEIHEFFLQAGEEETVEPCPRKNVEGAPKEHRQSDADREVVKKVQILEAIQRGSRGRALESAAETLYLLPLGQVYRRLITARASKTESTGSFVFMDVSQRTKPLYLIFVEQTYKNGILKSTAQWHCSTFGLDPRRRRDSFRLMARITDWPMDPEAFAIPEEKIDRVFETTGREMHFVFTRPMCYPLVERIQEGWGKLVTFSEGLKPSGHPRRSIGENGATSRNETTKAKQKGRETSTSKNAPANNTDRTARTTETDCAAHTFRGLLSGAVRPRPEKPPVPASVNSSPRKGSNASVSVPSRRASNVTEHGNISQKATKDAGSRR